MYAAPFDYYRATSVAEAIQLLGQHPGAKLLAGGHSLLPAMKLRVSQPPVLVDIGRIGELAGITRDGDRLRIGAMTTHDTLANSDLLRQHCPILAEAAALIGDQQVRNRGTIGGSLAHSDPAADLPTVIVAIGQTLTAVGPNGSRDIAAGGFCTDLFTTALAEDEVLTAITVPVFGPGIGSAYVKHEHPASGYAVVGVAAVLGVEDGAITLARIAIGGASNVPVRATEAEVGLMGQAPGEQAFNAAAEQAGAMFTEPHGDHYASGDYRRHLAVVLTRRALKLAAERA
jgi:aerobic carbon-monoxide dehydrogenase medium subunit